MYNLLCGMQEIARASEREEGRWGGSVGGRESVGGRKGGRASVWIDDRQQQLISWKRCLVPCVCVCVCVCMCVHVCASVHVCV